MKEKLTLEYVVKNMPELIISYNYRYRIGTDIIDFMQKRIINLHISYLPWNRGASPNLWSFIDDTPKGVTIHLISESLDKGNILYRQQCTFDAEKETFASTYEALHRMIAGLFMEHWEEIRTGSFEDFAQPEGGSCHSVRDTEKLMKEMPFEWTDRISDVLLRYRKMKDRTG